MSIGRDMVLAIKLFLDNKQYKPALDQAVSDTQNAAQRMSAAHNLSAQEMQGEAGKLIAKLKEQNDTFNMSANELRRYKAAQVEMSDAQRAATNALLSNLEAMEAQTGASAGGLRALAAGSSVATAGVAVLAAAALTLGVAYHQAQQETLAYEKAIILSGNAAGVTSGQLADMARRIDGVAGTQANAAAALASMTAGGKVAQENLEKVALAAIEMERATGQAIGETEKIFTSLGKDPVKASLRLNESMNYLTASTYAQMKAAEDLGDKEAAASIAQNAAADVMRTRAAEIEQHLGSLQRVMRGVRSVAAEMWDAVLDIGRPATLDSQIAALNNKIKQTAWRGPAATEDLQQQVAYLQEQQRMIRRGTEAQAENNRVQEARIELFKALEQSASKQEKMAIAIAQANALADRSGASAAERAQLVSAAREKFTEKESKAAKAALSDYDKLMQRLGTDVPKAAAEAEAAQHGYNKAQGEFLVLAGSPAWAKYTNEQRASVAAQFEAKIASEQATEATKAYEKATAEASKAREKALSTAEKELEKLQASVTAQQEQNDRLGLTKEAIADLDAAKLEMLATDKELEAAQALFVNGQGDLYEVLIKQAKAYRDLAQAKRDGAAKQVDIDREKQIEDVAGKAAKEGEKAAERIEQSLTDSLMRGFEAGKDMARNLRDTVVNMFKTMVLRPMVSAIVSPVAGAITGAMGLASAGQSAAGSAAGSMGSSLLGSAIGGMGAFGTGASYGAASLFANGLTGTLAAGGQMIGAGSVMSGLGTIAGALGPIAIGIALLSSLIKKSTPHMGAASSYSEAGGLVSGADIYRASGLADTRTYNAGVEQVTGNVAKAIGDTLNATAKAFGQTAGYEITTAFADDTSKDGAWGSLIIKQLGESVLDWRDTQTSKWAPKEFADGEAGSKEYLAAVAKSARDALVTAIGDVDWATDMLKGLGESVSLESLSAAVTQINAAKAAFVGFGQYLGAFAAQSDAAVSALVKASGGVDALAGNMSVFVDGFYTDAEKLAVNTGNVRTAIEALGLEMPTTRDAFRAMVEEQIALGTEGAAAAAGLLAVSGAFAAVVPAAEAAASGVDAISDAMRRLQSDTAALQVDLLRAQGDTAGADAAQRAIDTSGMTEAEIAVYDYNASIRAQISTLNELTAAAEQQTERMAQASASRWDIENEILRLQGKGAEAVAREREAELATLSALDPALVGLQRELYALRDAADAAADAAANAAANVGTATREDQMLAVRDLLSRAGLQQVDATRGPGFPDTLDVFQMPVFVKGLQDFYSSFVRPDEEKTNLTGALESQLAALGREMFTSPDEYKDLVKGLSKELADSYGTWIQTYTKNVNGEDTLLASVDQDKLDAYNAKQSELVRLMDLSGMVAEVLGTELENAAAAGKSLADVARERAGLEMQLFALTGNTAAIRERELAALDPSNRVMQQRIWLLEDEKRIAEERNGLMNSLYGALGNTGALRADQLGKLDPANRALQEQVWQIEDAKAALEKALQAESASAQAAQQAAQERVSTLKSIFDTLKSNVDSLYDSVEATKAWGAAQANAFIDNALGNARATGYMPEADDLADAISGARGGLDKPYATEFEKQRDTLVLAGKLSELQGISGEQLTAAERQLKASEAQVEALDGMQAQGKALLESLSGNTAATLSIADAIANLSAAVLGAQAAATAQSIALAQGAAPANSYRTTVDQWAGGASASRIYGGSGSIILDVGNDWSQQRIADQIKSNLSIFGQRTDKSDYEALLAYARGKGIPGFAVGTNYVPRDMLAQIHEGEAIAPKARNPAAGGTQSNARLEALIEGLTARVQALQSELVAIKTNTSNMAANIDEVTEGGNAMRSRAVGVAA